MPGVYVTPRGHAGVSMGCLGLVFVPLAYLLMFGLALVLIAVLLSPFLLVALAGGACRAGDWALRSVPSYRARRQRVGPIRWDTRTLSGLAALFDKDKRRRMRWR
jgi:hypothetical protein